MPHRLVFAMILCLGIGTVLGQEAPTAQREAMKKLDFLTGTWEGGGSIEFVPGQKREFKGLETVRSKADGLVQTIEGIHRGQFGGKGAEVVIHNAFAVVTYDVKSKEYRFEAFTSRGNREDAVAKVTDRKLEWAMSIPQFGEVRYTISLDENGQWSEIGEVSKDGKEWRKFFDMKLHRVEAK
ncbi:MAG: hypothetical protein JWN86_3273 [Planctomycetota bacterium]|nr:hypothetical protein [Planctomycetota bacterium]